MKHDRRFSIEWIKATDLKLNPVNPRIHSKDQISQLKKSIQRFGFAGALIVGADNQVVAGHGRLIACRELGLNEVPVIRRSDLSEAEARAFSIADNKLTENATWDDRLLGEALRDLSALDLDFSLELTGFTIAEIDLKIEALSERNADKPDRADEIAEITEAPITKIGDLWLLGRHRLLCSNALDRAAYQALMQGKRAAMVFTDPPYNVSIDGHCTGKGKNRHREFMMASGEMSSGEFTDFLSQCMGHMARNSRSGSIHFYCMDWRHQFEILTAGRESYAELNNLCVWVKHNAGMGSFYRSQHELVFVFKHGATKHRNNVELGRHGRWRSNVWEYQGGNAFGRIGEEGNLAAIHPTVKPVAMIADAILDCSARGDIVLDAFLGVGSTMIAAERVGRNCFGIEIDPRYVDAAIHRWEKYTGDNAVHATTGKPFAEAVQQGKRHG